ncbi:MAG: cohesin domain-containing protein [bacterium]|nr:cohesin domain-containing protein [bacterium]
MKKYLLTILLGAFGVMAIAAPALAATSVSFTPVNVSVRQGQTFTLTIGVNPQGVKNYTAKTELHYPADLLEVKSFTFAPSWMPLAQSGYDLTDNTNGVFIKTAGHPGGISSAATFGTVSFLAKKSGNGTITLNSGNSLALDANNQNVLSTAPVQASVLVSAVSVPAEEQTEEQAPQIQEQEPGAEETAEETPSITEEEKQPEMRLGLAAAIGELVTLGTNNALVGILLAFVMILGGAWLARRYFASRPKS